MNGPTRPESGPIEEAIIALQTISDFTNLLKDECGSILARRAIAAAQRLQELRAAIARHDHQMDYVAVRPPNGDDYNELMSLLCAQTWGTAFGHPDSDPSNTATAVSPKGRTRVLFEEVSMGSHGQNRYTAVLQFDELDLRLQVQIVKGGDKGANGGTISSFHASAHQWRPLAKLETSALKTRPVREMADLRPEIFEQDSDELVRRALLILGR